MDPLEALSPLDGRYRGLLLSLKDFFSEQALMRYRCLVEIEYFIALSEEGGVAEFPPISAGEKKKLRSIASNFSPRDARQVKKIEKKTNHDVKAIEYFLQKKIALLYSKKYQHFIHFALTSEDINNCAYSLLWKHALHDVYLPALKKIHYVLLNKAHEWSDMPLLSLTHGQSATPTTIGKELAVFCERLRKPVEQLHAQTFTAKLNGATGTWAAHELAYPRVDWIAFSGQFIKRLGLSPNLYTTQVEGNDSLAQSFFTITHINAILIDLVQDLWLYCSRGIFCLERKKDEVGSSTMPHKINPIHFENAEGNMKLANAIFLHLATTLPISRLQRDLSGSTLIRNIGVPLAYSFIACQNMLIGFERLSVNKSVCSLELEKHSEVIAEGVQTILRKHGEGRAYEHIKKLTRGLEISRETLLKIIDALPLPEIEKRMLLGLRPQDYRGLSGKIALSIKPLRF